MIIVLDFCMLYNFRIIHVQDRIRGLPRVEDANVSYVEQLQKYLILYNVYCIVHDYYYFFLIGKYYITSCDKKKKSHFIFVTTYLQSKNIYNINIILLTLY